VATTQAVRPLLVEKRNWTKVFPEDRTLGVAAMRMERWLAGLYSNEANEGNGARPAQSVFEVRHMSREGNAEKDNGHFGWRNFGDFTWAEGYTNLHYDIHFIALREYLRTGDKTCLSTRQRDGALSGRLGQHQAVDYWIHRALSISKALLSMKKAITAHINRRCRVIIGSKACGCTGP